MLIVDISWIFGPFGGIFGIISFASSSGHGDT